jgi:hypothetical protein
MDEVEAEGREGTIVVRPEDVAFTAIRQKALDLLTLVRSGVDPEGAGGPQGFTVAEAIEKHISAPRRNPLAPSTVKYYRTVGKLYLPPWLKVPLRRLDGPASCRCGKSCIRSTGLLQRRWRCACWQRRGAALAFTIADCHRFRSYLVSIAG